MFVSMMFLHRLAESMNKNLNYLDLEPELWSEFQESHEYRGFKEIVNFRRTERKTALNPIREKLEGLTETSLMGNEEIDDFVHCNYKLTKYEHVKTPYRKVFFAIILDSKIGL